MIYGSRDIIIRNVAPGSLCRWGWGTEIARATRLWGARFSQMAQYGNSTASGSHLGIPPHLLPSGQGLVPQSGSLHRTYRRGRAVDQRREHFQIGGAPERDKRDIARYSQPHQKATE